MSRVHVMLIYGGQSTEHDVSIASARNVFAALDNTRNDISTCLICGAASFNMGPVDGGSTTSCDEVLGINSSLHGTMTHPHPPERGVPPIRHAAVSAQE